MAKQNVLRVTQSPMNAKRWCLSLACDHETWVTSSRRPKTKRTQCDNCDVPIELGTMGGGPAERDAATGTISQGPEVTARAKRADLAKALHKATLVDNGKPGDPTGMRRRAIVSAIKPYKKVDYSARRKQDRGELVVGMSLYRVVEDIDNDTWHVMARNVAAVTPQCIRLDRPFPFCSSTSGLFTKSRIGLVVFTSVSAAVQNFIANAQRNLEQAQRTADAARKALDWATSDEAVLVVRGKR